MSRLPGRIENRRRRRGRFLRRFRREVEAARRVGGESTAPVLDAGTGSANTWVAIGYVPGPALADTVERHGPLPKAPVLALADGLARALRAVHACDLIHLELKPSNVLVTIDGPRVINFGIARAVTRASLPGPEPWSARRPSWLPSRSRAARSPRPAMCSASARCWRKRPPVAARSSRAPTGCTPRSTASYGSRRTWRSPAWPRSRSAAPPPDEILATLPPPPPHWLPAAIIAEIGRHTAGLLDLEAPTPMPAQPAPSPSGSPPLTSPAHASPLLTSPPPSSPPPGPTLPSDRAGSRRLAT
ncbi:protein kinase domain-containing protein [Actinomadura chokoriensis]|uniref:Protein kinase domain-containing protein n=1 Tax=Actinomadura chokoriensis TaxID=454156 RepID=A0ABV4RAM2_9ACTN